MIRAIDNEGNEVFFNPSNEIPNSNLHWASTIQKDGTTKLTPILPDTRSRPSGLKDINSKEIYEHDILIDCVEVDGQIVESKIPVVYSPQKAAFCVDLSYSKDGTHLELLCDNYEGLAVCGNIFKDAINNHINDTK
jgi:hypothetical protein